MTDTPPKPKRRRWRWLLVGILTLGLLGLILVPLAEDSRVIGKWHWHRTDSGPPIWTVELKRNGVAKLYTMEGVHAFTNTWQVSNGELMFAGSSLDASPKKWMVHLAAWWSGEKLNASPNGPFTLLDVAEDSFFVQRVGTDVKMQFVRVPE